jgi:hypothetical protein
LPVWRKTSIAAAISSSLARPAPERPSVSMTSALMRLSVAAPRIASTTSRSST